MSFVLPMYLSMPVGGYRVVYEHADFLAAHGHDVTIVFPFRLQPVPAGSGRLLEPIRSWRWARRSRRRNRPLVPWHRLHERIRLALVRAVEDRFIPDGDVVMATAWSTAAPVAGLCAAKGRKFYLIQNHEIWDGPEAQVNASWHLKLHKIVISRWLAELGEQLGAQDIRHIPNGIDHRRFKVITPPAERGLRILSLYHTSWIKGVDDALAVLSTYHDLFPEVPVTMFGAMPRGVEVPDWIGYIHNPPQDVLVRDLYNGHAIYLSASRLEGWALPPAEAMACGCAFVGTDIGGFRDYATHGDTALLSPVGDRQGLLRNLIAITENADLRDRIQQRGTANIRQFTWARAGAELEATFLGQNANA